MVPVRPEFVPDPGQSRAEMEDLQRDVADAAVFEDDIGFDPAAIELDAPVEVPDPGDGTQTSLAASRADDRSAPLVAGVDQAFLDERAVSVVVVLRGSTVVERAHAVTDLSIPYVPGLLSFREGGPILAAFERLDSSPDVALFDGSGRIHFRQAGLATHMGVVLDLPSVGVAKSLLCGRPRESVDGRPRGWRTPIEANDRVDAPAGTVLGYAYQSRQYDSRPIVNPLYVSPGHRVSAATAVDLVARTCAGYKLPEPTRLADAYADEVKRTVD
ncbi:MAG: endonuclease V [Salinigranum sp.]